MQSWDKYVIIHNKSSQTDLTYGVPFRKIIIFSVTDRDVNPYSHPGNTKGRRGHPYYVAAIDFRQETEEERLVNEFLKVCSSLNYREIMALSRVCKVTPRTVQNWKYGRTIPGGNGWLRQSRGASIMSWVISWTKLGRPLVRYNTGKPGRPTYYADVEVVEGKHK